MASTDNANGSESSSHENGGTNTNTKHISSTFDVEPGNDFEDSYHARHGTTQADKQDMNRMGKTQELRVSTALSLPSNACR